MENNKPQDIKIEFPNCPQCGSDKRLSNEVLEKEKAKGKMPESSVSFLFKQQPIIAADMNWITAPVVTAAFDVCIECGTTWCISAVERQVLQGAHNLPSNTN